MRGKKNIKTGYTERNRQALKLIYTTVVVIKVIYVSNLMYNYLNISYEI